MLMGAKLFLDLLGQGQTKLVDSGPTLKETKFDWIISGPILCKNQRIKGNVIKVSLLSQQIMNNLEEQISRFWRLKI